MGRKKARDNAFKCIYQFEFEGKEDINNILNYCYQENDNSDEEKEYIQKIVMGVSEKYDEINNIILSKLKGWTISRIAKIDLAILRLSIYEIMYTDIPEKVSVNEAVEIAKTYGDDNSSNFVNGVLAKVIESKNNKEGKNLNE